MTRGLQTPHVLVSQFASVALFQDCAYSYEHLLLVLLKRSVDGQVVGCMNPHKFQVIYREILKEDLHLFQGFKGVHDFKFPLLDLIKNDRIGDGCEGEGSEVVRFHLVGDLCRGDGMFL